MTTGIGPLRRWPNVRCPGCCGYPAMTLPRSSCSTPPSRLRLICAPFVCSILDGLSALVEATLGCGPFGETVSEQADIVPAGVQVIQDVRFKYGPVPDERNRDVCAASCRRHASCMMRDHVDLAKSWWGIIPVVERTDLHRPPDSGVETDTATATAAGRNPGVDQKPIDRCCTDAQDQRTIGPCRA